jgi:hypothetical protein
MLNHPGPRDWRKSFKHALALSRRLPVIDPLQSRTKKYSNFNVGSSSGSLGKTGRVQIDPNATGNKETPKGAANLTERTRDDPFVAPSIL